MDAYQRKAEAANATEYNMPVLHLPQLIGLALGLDTEVMDFKRHLVPVDRVSRRSGCRPAITWGPMLLYDAPDCWKCVEVKDTWTRWAWTTRASRCAAIPRRGPPWSLQGEPPLVPMLVDGDLAVWDRRRILAYLQQTYGAGGGTPFREMPVFMGGVCAVGDPGSCG